MSYSQQWLEDKYANRIVLVECTVYNVSEAEEQTVLFSNGGYLTADGVSHFAPLVMGGVTVSEKLNREGNVTMSVGDIAISNADGRFDAYLGDNYIWVNRPIVVYYGDPSWTVSSLTELRSGSVFKIVFNGIISDIGSSQNDVINIKLRDKLERLNTPVTEQKIGDYGVWAGGQQNQDQVTPLVFGEVHNITPTLVDPSMLEYRFSTGVNERLIEVRDNGIPLEAITANTAAGTFKLGAPSAGTITCSVQGIKNSIDLSTGSLLTSYTNNIANLVALITTQYGANSNNRLTASDLDLPELLTFASSNTQPVGLYLGDRDNVLSVCQQLVSSIGGQLFMTREGKLRIVRFGTALSGVANVSITPADILENTLQISERISVTASTKLGFCKNWTVQTGLLTAIPEQHKEMYAQEWYTITAEDTSVKNRYKLDAEPAQKNTLLLKEVDASAEASRVNNLFKTPRTVYRFSGTPRLMSLVLGQAVTLTHPRFNLSTGKAGQVVGLNINWAAKSIEVEVLI